MKAYILKENGPYDNLVLTDIPEPGLSSDEVLVQVKAISINPVDAAVRNSKQALTRILSVENEQEYYIIGWDVSGTVVKAGEKAAGYECKDVFGMVNFPGQGRAYAEYVSAPVNQIAVKPSEISHEEAAGATLAALTAWQALVTYGKITKDDKVIIHGASGGVGHYAVQIAKHIGAFVIGIASSPNKHFVMDLGADQFIDYTTERFEEIINDADLVIDSVNDRQHLARSIDALRKGGRLISIKYYFDEELKSRARKKGLYTDRILVKSNGEDMEKIAELLNSGNIRTYVSEKYPFSELPESHKLIETGKTRGKIIITL